MNVHPFQTEQHPKFITLCFLLSMPFMVVISSDKNGLVNLLI